MPAYSEWGYLGALIFLVVSFGAFLLKREASSQAYNEKRDKEWRDFFTSISAGNQTDIADMRATAEHLVKSLDALAAMSTQHDTRAQAIQQAIEAIKVDLAKLAKQPRGKAA